nr:PREDICTED: protein fem-1 homolog B-like isoform X2 [Bemisia tabaci]
MSCELLKNYCSNLIHESRVFYFARDGMAMSLYTILADLDLEQVRKLLNKQVVDAEGQRCTPLIIAAHHGHDKVVKVLLKFPVDLEQEGLVKLNSFTVKGASALWCAAGSGHLNVVKTLVKAGADVNHATHTMSTPLRAACFEGRLDIVQYLYDHGADIHKANIFNNSCLMLAAYKGHLDVVSYLLEKGADPMQHAKCEGTVLHYAAENGNVEVIKELLNHGAVMTKNNYGLTPVLVAAERTRAAAVEYFVTRPELSLEEKIDALELLGASFACDKDNYDLTKASHYLERSMDMRYSDPDNIIRKPKFTPIPAYQNWIESQTPEDVRALRLNGNSLYNEALTVRERILGSNNPEVPAAVVYRGAIFADHANFHRCIDLWLHALHLSQSNRVCVSKDLLRFAQIFSQMIYLDEYLKFSHVEEVLAAAVLEFERNKERIEINKQLGEDTTSLQERVESNVITALYILVILTKVMKLCDETEGYRVRQLIFRLNKLRVTSRQGQTLLHLCLDSETPVDNFHTNDVCKFPCLATAKLLIQCGADVNAMDSSRNTPLHVIVCVQKPINDYLTVHSIIKELTEAGAHIDTVNKDGKTPFEAATRGVAEIILSMQRQLSLKCMAAKVVKQNNIPYQGLVPKALESFIELHGTAGGKKKST